MRASRQAAPPNNFKHLRTWLLLVPFVFPFARPTDWTACFCHQMVLGSVLLVPIRLLIIVLLLVLGWLVVRVALIGLTSNQIQNKPLSSWRKRLLIAVRWTMFFAFLVALTQLKAFSPLQIYCSCNTVRVGILLHPCYRQASHFPWSAHFSFQPRHVIVYLPVSHFSVCSFFVFPLDCLMCYSIAIMSSLGSSAEKKIWTYQLLVRLLLSLSLSLSHTHTLTHTHHTHTSHINTRVNCFLALNSHFLLTQEEFLLLCRIFLLTGMTHSPANGQCWTSSSMPSGPPVCILKSNIIFSAVDLCSSRANNHYANAYGWPYHTS